MRTAWPEGTTVEQIVTDLLAEVRTAALPFDAKIDVPEQVPKDWLTKPDWLEPGQKLTVLASGQAAGYWFQHGTCLVHDPRACPKPDPTGYRMFAQNGEVEGVPVGVIGNVHGHASPTATVQQAQAHYSDPDAAMLIGACGDDEHGAWFAGCLIPDKEWTGKDVAFLNRCALSGDWRPLPFDSPWWEQNGVTRAAVQAADGYSSLGPTLVTRPALPLVRSYAMAAAARGDGDDRPVLLGGLGGIQLPDDDEAYPCADCEKENAMTAAATDEKSDELSVDLTVDDKTMSAIEKFVDEKVAERLADELKRRDDEAKKAKVKERVAAVEVPSLPAPAGFDERTIHLTTADFEHIEARVMQAATTAPSPKSAADRPAAQRQADEKSGVSMPGGGYPIRTCGDAKNARQAVGRAAPGDRPKVLAHIARREKVLGCDNGPVPSRNGNG